MTWGDTLRDVRGDPQVEVCPGTTSSLPLPGGGATFKWMIAEAAEKPLWQVLRHEIEGGDKPHHVANYILRRMGVVQPPVPVESIARRLGVRLIRSPNLGLAGMLESSEAAATVRVNSSEPPVRQRFTIAHEVGHLLLHPIGTQFRDEAYGPTGDWKEREANEFAAALLIPLWLIEPIVLGSNRNGKDLADLFEVSQAAMAVQLKKLL